MRKLGCRDSKKRKTRSKWTTEEIVLLKLYVGIYTNKQLASMLNKSKVSVVATKQFPAITDKAEQYCEAVKLVHTKLADSRSFTNYRNGEIVPSKLRQHARTVDFLEHLEAEQTGDILIIAVQYGMRHRGKSVRRARETFASNEFGLGAFAIGCMALVHSERYVRWKELDTDCAGDEFAPVADGDFSESPLFDFDGGGLGFGTGGVSCADDGYGSVSGFVPQN